MQPARGIFVPLEASDIGVEAGVAIEIECFGDQAAMRMDFGARRIFAFGQHAEFFADADLMIHDAQFTLGEADMAATLDHLAMG